MQTRDYIEAVQTLVRLSFGNDASPTFFIRTFGCQQNDHDSEIAAGLLLEMGFEEADSAELASLVLFNTCSVREHADDRFYGHLGNLKTWSREPNHYIGVMGCMPGQAVHRDEINRAFPYVNFLLNAGDMGNLPRALYTTLTSENSRGLLDFTTLPKDLSMPLMPIKRERPFRALLSIMTGCNNFCTYCIVPHARGREKSRPRDVILTEAMQAVEKGAKEIMLLGQNVNSYGLDQKDRRGYGTFAKLIDDVANIEGLSLVRYMTSHPKDLSDELIATIGENKIIEPHIHLPLQSGSDRILKKMNRHYTVAHYMALVEKLRSVRPEISITTDLIVGFPGETETDFNETLRVMEAVRFDRAFTFIYSPRPGTPAATWENGSTEEEIHERFDRLVELQNRHSQASNERLVGETVDVLTDGISRQSSDILSGRTRDDRLVNFASATTSQQGDSLLNGRGKQVITTCRAGDEARVIITAAKPYSLEGKLVAMIG